LFRSACRRWPRRFLTFGLCVHTGKEVLEGNRVGLCGPRGRPDADRRVVRGGHTPKLADAGWPARDHAPAARALGCGELSLPSFGWAEKRDPLNEATLAAVAAGVSTRRYAGTLDRLPAGELQSSASRSSVSRRFVALSTAQLGERFSHRLDQLDLSTGTATPVQ
jgi:putative transposase